MKNRPLPRRSSFPLALAQLALAAGLATAAPWAAAAIDAKASRFYEDALMRWEKKDVPGAIVQLKNALQADKTLLPVHMLLGKALLANGEVGAAEVAFTEALRLGVNRAEVVLPLADAVIGQGKQPELISQQRFATAGLPPGLQMELLLKKAQAQSDMGDPKSALQLITEARSINANHADTWLAEVPVRIRTRQFKEALAAIDRATALAPASADAAYQKASVLHAQGDMAGARTAYDRAVELNPKNVEALVARAGLLIDIGRQADAEQDLAALKTLAPREPRSAFLRALLADRAGNAAAAKAALLEITALLDPAPIAFLRFRPQMLMLGGLAHYGLNQKELAKPYLEGAQRAQAGSSVSKLLAQIYLGEKNYDRAIESLEIYLRAVPGDAQAKALLASTHMAQGRYARATQLMQEALRTQDSPQLRTVLGMSLSGAGKSGDAIVELEAAYKKDPTQTQAGSALVGLYLQRNERDKAISVAQGLVKRTPQDPGAQNLLGMALARSGEGKGARAAFEQAARLDEAFLAPRLNLARMDITSGAYDAATTRLAEILKKDERNVEASMEMGMMAAVRNQVPEATRWLEKAADLSTGTDLRASLALVDFHLAGGRAGPALDATKRLVTKAPDDLRTLLALARAQLANGDTTTTKSTLTRATSLANFEPATQVEIALLQLAADNAPGAAYSLEKALAEKPDLLSAQALMVDVDLRRNELPKAEQTARQIATRYPRLAIGQSLQGDVAAAKGQWPAAADFYRKAHQLEPSSDSVLRLFRALNASNAAPAALQLVEQWSRTRPQDLRVRKTLADAQARAGNLAAARGSYEAVLKLSPNDAEAANNLVNVLILVKEPSALAVAEAALAKNPNVPQLLGSAGWAAFHAGNNDRALQLLRDARLRDPENRDTRYFLAAVLAKSGRSGEARSELEAALQAGRNFASAADAESLLRTLK